MIKISTEEVLKIAEMSRLSVHADEIEQMKSNLEVVLSYAERVQEVSGDVQEPSNANVNVFRADVVCKSDPEKVLAQAPCREENYFVVPVIIEK